VSPLRRTPTPVGLLIAQAMAAANMTQGQLARRLGVSQPSVSRWMSTPVLPAVEVVHEIAKVLDIDLGTLLAAAAQVRPDRQWITVPVEAEPEPDPRLVMAELAVLVGRRSPLRRTERRTLIEVLDHIVRVYLD
jgi:transcriptional regulator with XRE-family HTH domain